MPLAAPRCWCAVIARPATASLSYTVERSAHNEGAMWLPSPRDRIPFYTLPQYSHGTPPCNTPVMARHVTLPIGVFWDQKSANSCLVTVKLICSRRQGKTRPAASGIKFKGHSNKTKTRTPYPHLEMPPLLPYGLFSPPRPSVAQEYCTLNSTHHRTHRYKVNALIQVGHEHRGQ